MVEIIQKGVRAPKLEDEDHIFARWEPLDVTVMIDADRSFRYEDDFGNVIQGKFISERSARGTFKSLHVEDVKQNRPLQKFVTKLSPKNA